MRKTIITAFLAFCLSFSAWANEGAFKDNRPDSYVVKKGDTLWDISNVFLKTPWYWPEIWHVNQQIANPHLIYPGDVISLIYIDGKPYLTVDRNIRLSPQIRYENIDQAISAIPLDVINSFLSRSRIVEEGELEKAPYVISGKEKRLIMASGDDLYARGSFPEDIPSYGFYRKAETYKDPKTKEVLGVLATDIATGDMLALNKDVATLKVVRATEEIRVGDRLLPHTDALFDSTFFPSSPEKEIEGSIIGVEEGVSQVGMLSVVIINKGARESLKPGNILIIYKRSLSVKDRIAKDTVELPEEQAGMVMIFKAFEKLSLGLVLKADRGITTEDIVRNP